MCTADGAAHASPDPCSDRLAEPGDGQVSQCRANCSVSRLPLSSWYGELEKVTARASGRALIRTARVIMFKFNVNVCPIMVRVNPLLHASCAGAAPQQASNRQGGSAVFVSRTRFESVLVEMCMCPRRNVARVVHCQQVRVTMRRCRPWARLVLALQLSHHWSLCLHSSLPLAYQPMITPGPGQDSLTSCKAHGRLNGGFTIRTAVGRTEAVWAETAVPF